MAKVKYKINGEEVTQAKFDARLPSHPIEAPMPRQRPEGWPMVSTAMAVNIEQVELAQKKDRELGAPATEYKPDREGYSAQPVFTSEAHKRQFIKAHGMHDRNAFC